MNNDSQALALACAAEVHEPLIINQERVAGEAVVYGYVRTSSFHLDGCGGRTDIHDVWSALWAGVLRANGVASARLIDEVGWCGPPELSARYLVFEQMGTMSKSDCSVLQWYRAHTALAFHALAETFRWAEVGLQVRLGRMSSPDFFSGYRL